MTDTELQRLMFSKENMVSPNKRMPDYNYIHKELLRNGVSKKLLWTEYMEDCRANGEEPLMYSQFCYHIQQDEQKRRATMHINRKPGEQVEVDWAGDPATIIDPDTGEIIKAYIFVGVMTYSQYAYVEACMDMKQKPWINAHIHIEYSCAENRISGLAETASPAYRKPLLRVYSRNALSKPYTSRIDLSFWGSMLVMLII